jgi:16S rRNA (cytidine1402-2'-O)-methyltransferase
MSGRLVIVATPIGNLDDLSPRALATLRSADIIAAEDTRRTGRLLSRFEVATPQVAYHDHSDEARLVELVGRVRAGATVALVSDAGTPGVSDPGYRLVRVCLDEGLDVDAIPGPSSVLHALVVSGLPTDRFVFEGFLPRKGRARSERLREIADDPRTTVVFVAPHRAGDDLADLVAATGGDRRAALCRELTKLHEQVLRAPIGELARRFADEAPRGEVTLVLAGRPPVAEEERTPQQLVDEVRLRVAAGVTKRDAIAEVATEASVPKREVYQAVVDAGL